jgi:hypothetical protein
VYNDALAEEEKRMWNCQTDLCEDEFPQDEQDCGVRPIGEILEELLARYQVRFSDLNVSVVETAGTPV